MTCASVQARSLGGVRGPDVGWVGRMKNLDLARKSGQESAAVTYKSMVTLGKQEMRNHTILFIFGDSERTF